jgi:hypothetical protein
VLNTDLTFITNEQGQHLKDRFEVLIKDAQRKTQNPEGVKLTLSNGED